MQTPNKHPKGRSFVWVEYLFIVGTWINCFPFKYEKASRRFVLTHGLRLHLWVILTLSGTIVEFFQTTWALFQPQPKQQQSQEQNELQMEMEGGENQELEYQRSSGEWCLVLFVWMSWLAVIVNLGNSYYRRHEFVNSTNKMIQTREYFTEAKLALSTEHRILQSYMVVGGLQCFFQCIMVAQEGWKKHYLYSNLPLEYRNPVTNLIWTLYAYFRVMSNYGQGFFTLCCGILHIQTCNQILTLRSQLSLEPQENIKIYRILQLLSIWFNESYSSVTVPNWTTFAVTNIILGNFGAIRFFGVLEPAAYLNFPLMNIFMILFCITYYPRKATLKERSECEKKRILWQSIEMMAALDKLKNSRRQSVLDLKTHEEVQIKLWKISMKWRRKIPARHHSQGNRLPKGVNENVPSLNVLTPSTIIKSLDPGASPNIGKGPNFNVGDPGKREKNEVSNNQQKATVFVRSPRSEKKAAAKKWQALAALAMGKAQDFPDLPGADVLDLKQGVSRLKEIECYTRSCPVIGVHMGSFYIIQRSTVLTLFDFIACNTVSALLTF